MSVLIKMSLRGVVIILVVLFVRFLMKKLQIGHKYILGLWIMAFLYFIFPWKLSLSVGFWNNANIPEEIEEISEIQSVVYETGNLVDSIGGADNTMVDASAAVEKDMIGTVTAIPVESSGQNIAGINEIKENSPGKFEVKRVIGLIWLMGFGGLFVHMLCSYFALKRKLRLSVLWKDNIWWAED